MRKVRLSGKLGKRRDDAPKGKTDVGRQSGERGNGLPTLPPQAPQSQGLPEKVRFWTTHGFKHGIIVEVGIRPFGRKRVVWVNVDDVFREGS